MTTDATVPTLSSQIEENLLGYTCSQCGASRVMTLTADQIEGIREYGLRKLRPNICPTCEMTVLNPKMSHSAAQEAEAAASMPADGFRRWLAEKRAVAAKCGATATIRENIAARIAQKMIWIATRKAGEKTKTAENQYRGGRRRQVIETEDIP